MSTLLGVGGQVAFGNSNSDLVQAIRESTQESTNQAGQDLVEKDLNVQPTITVRPGWPLRVIVNIRISCSSLIRSERDGTESSQRLPDRMPVKITIDGQVPSSIGCCRTTRRYMRRLTGRMRRLPSFAPTCCNLFFEGDRGFQKARKATEPKKIIGEAMAVIPDILQYREGWRLGVGQFRHYLSTQGCGSCRTTISPGGQRTYLPRILGKVRNRCGVESSISREAIQRDYLSVKLDDPGMTEPIGAALFASPEGRERES